MVHIFGFNIKSKGGKKHTQTSCSSESAAPADATAAPAAPVPVPATPAPAAPAPAPTVPVPAPPYPAMPGALMAQYAGELDGSFTVISNVQGHQVVDPYAAIDLSKAHIQHELERSFQPPPVVGHTGRLVLTHAVISNVGGNQYGIPQARSKTENLTALYTETEPSLC